MTAARRSITKRRTKAPQLSARNADKFDLYQRTVQSPDVDVRFLSRLHRRLTGRPLRHFREDFCGTFKLSCEFVGLHRENRAVGVDLDGPTLDWGREHNLAALNEEQRSRITLLQEDVTRVHRPRVDLVNAMNFSYCVFKTRDELLGYVRNVRKALVPGGLLAMDVHGGPEAQEVREEATRKRGYTYIWDQADFDPVSHNAVCKIHFAFRDGTRLRNAFVYDWRIWTLPELREILTEAGFARVQVMWEGTDRDTDEGNGIYYPVRRGHPDPSWIAYVIGQAP